MPNPNHDERGRFAPSPGGAHVNAALRLGRATSAQTSPVASYAPHLSIRKNLVPLSPHIHTALSAIRKAGGTPLLVGGAVRDAVLGLAPKDADFEVYGLDADAITSSVSHLGRVDAVGKAFGVLKIRLADGSDLDLAVPRRENKTGAGYKGFQVKPDPTMTVEEAAARRDFTVNAMAWNPETGELHDYFGGEADLGRKMLRHVGAAFAEDPLRVLRGMQFAARWGFDVAPETIELCKSLRNEYAALPKERVYMEWQKLFQKGIEPSRGIAFMEQAGWLSFTPQLSNLRGIQQDPQHHPECDALTHTGLVMDAAARIAKRDNLSAEEREQLVVAALCHDLGKVSTTVVGADGRIRSPGHAEASVPLTDAFLDSIGYPLQGRAAIKVLVREHMSVLGTEPTPRAVRRLANRLAPVTIETWSRIVEADHSGRQPLPPSNPAEAWVTEARRLGVGSGAPKPFLTGHALLLRGLKAGPQFKAILGEAMTAQEDGVITDAQSAEEWLTAYLKQP